MKFQYGLKEVYLNTHERSYLCSLVEKELGKDFETKEQKFLVERLLFILKGNKQSGSEYYLSSAQKRKPEFKKYPGWRDRLGKTLDFSEMGLWG